MKRAMCSAITSSLSTRPVLAAPARTGLALLWGREPLFRLNDDALEWLATSALSRHLVTRIRAALPWDQELTAAELTSQLVLQRDLVRSCRAAAAGACGVRSRLDSSGFGCTR